MLEQLSLDRLFAVQGCSELGVLLLLIRKECPHEIVCKQREIRCGAMITILKVVFSVQENIHSFFNNFKAAVKK